MSHQTIPINMQWVKKNSAIYRSCEISMWKIGPTIFKRQTRRSEEKLYRS